MKEIDGFPASSEQSIIDIKFVEFVILMNSLNKCSVGIRNEKKRRSFSYLYYSKNSKVQI